VTSSTLAKRQAADSLDGFEDDADPDEDGTGERYSPDWEQPC
jgi:hypothetical protein